MHSDYGLHQEDTRILLPKVRNMMKEQEEQRQERSTNVPRVGDEHHHQHDPAAVVSSSTLATGTVHSRELAEDAVATTVTLEEGVAEQQQHQQQQHAVPSADFSSALLDGGVDAAAGAARYSSAALPQQGGGGVARGFASALDDRQQERFKIGCYCGVNQDRAVFLLGLLLFVTFCVTFYFAVPWVPVLRDLLDWIDERGTRGILLLFVLHQLALYSIVGPASTLEYGWVYLRGWSATPYIILSYVIAIAVMLYIGNTALRPWIVRRVRDNRLLQATQLVLDQHPYAWYVAFQFWSLVPWRASVYCAHVLAPHANLAGIGVAVLVGQLPYLINGIFLATKITNLDSLVTGRLDTRRDTTIFWASVVLTLLISLLLYVKIKRAFVEAAGSEARRRRRPDPETTPTTATTDGEIYLTQRSNPETSVITE
jgi:uncharacterized membrane protein YdjX (TVP38/TMEM64 family)